MKKISILLVICLALVSLLCGCGTSASEVVETPDVDNTPAVSDTVNDTENGATEPEIVSDNDVSDANVAE